MFSQQAERGIFSLVFVFLDALQTVLLSSLEMVTPFFYNRLRIDLNLLGEKGLLRIRLRAISENEANLGQI